MGDPGRGDQADTRRKRRDRGPGSKEGVFKRKLPARKEQTRRNLDASTKKAEKRAKKNQGEGVKSAVTQAIGPQKKTDSRMPRRSHEPEEEKQSQNKKNSRQHPPHAKRGEGIAYLGNHFSSRACTVSLNHRTELGCTGGGGKSVTIVKNLRDDGKAILRNELSTGEAEGLGKRSRREAQRGARSCPRDKRCERSSGRRRRGKMGGGGRRHVKG